MRIVCLFGVFLGAAILLLSILKFYRSLQIFRQEANQKRIFSNWLYGLCLALMIFFFIGYVALGVVYLTHTTVSETDLLISAVFFFGAIFVYVVVTVQGRMSETISGQTDEIVRTLVNAMEAKDRYTRGHSVHVSNLVRIFYTKLPERLRREINKARLIDASILHDVGKIGIQDDILNKPGKLTEDEWAAVRQHPRLGKDILDQTSFKDLGHIILCHHERMDQNGYYRIPPNEIPLESKIIAIADTFSALYTDRVYRPRYGYDEAIHILREAAGSQLDPDLVELFCGITEEEILGASRGLFSMEFDEAVAQMARSSPRAQADT
ncbi:HD domain-containing protein [Oscillospiraceae bacterium OttesenSCG-928-G22]|nr:HD domain-containing protein [Oscillospiraceae bacterium OttesenSCG-928-G22]